MDFSKIIQMLGDRFDQGLQKSNDNITKLTNVAKDRVNQTDPNFVGPPAPMHNDELAEHYNNLATGVMGSMAPVQGAEKMVADTAGEALKRKLLNETVAAGAEMPTVQRAQQALSREADFAERARQQKFNRLKGMFNK